MNSFICIGDTHGNHNLIKHRVKSLQISDTTLIHVGDFGIGFKKETEDRHDVLSLNKLLKLKNIHLYVIRGNHDNPYYFNGEWDFSNVHLMPDYSVITINGDDILLVGGAISIDRKPRLKDMQRMASQGRDIELYWFDEGFKLDKDKLKNIKGVTYVITHSAPNFVPPENKVDFGHLVNSFAADDPKLKEDLIKERQDITYMYEILKENNLVDKWLHGHFHRHNAMYYEDTDFVSLGIDEFYTVRQY